MIAAVGLAVGFAPSSFASTATSDHANTARPSQDDCDGPYEVCLYGPPPDYTYFGDLPCTVQTWQYGGLLGMVVNFCETRVWLHQNNDGKGWTLCIDPDEQLSTNYNDAIANVQITSNTSNC